MYGAITHRPPHDYLGLERIPERSPARAGQWSGGTRRKRTANGRALPRGLAPKASLLLSQEQPRPHRRWTPVQGDSSFGVRIDHSPVVARPFAADGEVNSGLKNTERAYVADWFTTFLLGCAMPSDILRVCGH